MIYKKQLQHEIEVVADNITNVNLVGADIANVNTVATIVNVSSVNNFGSKYKISANAPSNTEGIFGSTH